MDSQPVRFWDNFGYNRQTMLIDLGADIHPIGHQNETGRHLANILEKEIYPASPLSGEGTGILMFACRIHDMGESMHPRIAQRIGSVVGDIPAGKKTDDQRAIEKKVRHFVYAELYPDIDPAVIERVEAIISHQDTTKLHDYFEAAHELQTFDTAMKAYEKWQEGIFYHHDAVMDIGGPDGGRNSALLGLHRAVFSVSGVNLLKIESRHPHIADVLTPYRDELLRHQAYLEQKAA